jgi:selenide,water dikinase
VQALPTFSDPNLLVGAEHFSDAGVYRLADGLSIVQTLDFFPPLVDDPFVFGQIAAANAMSDVYAMGGQPKTALNVVGFPDDKLELSVLQEIMAGGAERVRSAGAVIVGGHSVRDVEIKYGLSVTGIVDPAKMMTNDGAKPGDVLVLTKSLGTGFITTALKADKCTDDVLATACASMIQLNRAGSETAVSLGVRAATDITGFGLAGHALEMAKASDVSITIQMSRLPLRAGALELAQKGHHTRANATNRQHVQPSAQFDVPADSALTEFLFDPQTSGGLLLAVNADSADDLLSKCRSSGHEASAVIGSVDELKDHHLVIQP